MQIRDSKFHKCWKKEVLDNGMIKIDIGDSKKNKDGTYENFTFFGALLVSGAKESGIEKGDTFTIKSGIISKRKYEGKYYDDIVIFDLEVTKKSESTSKSNDEYDFSKFETVEESDDLPF